jgi:hypothetical protein
MDPTIPHFGILQYDWIISLEVALHIPEKYEVCIWIIYLGMLRKE